MVRLARTSSSVAVAALTATLAACGGTQHDPSLVPVPVGRSAAFRPPSLPAAVGRGLPVGAFRCTRSSHSRFGVHVEVFAAGRVVVVPAGIGIAGPRRRDGAYVVGGRCRYALMTREPTGVVEVTSGTRATLGDLFRLWGQPLSRTGVAAFTGSVRAHVGGRAWSGDPRAIPLTPHAQVVVQVGPAIVPHSHYAFPPGL